MSELSLQTLVQGGTRTAPAIISTYNENHLVLTIEDTTGSYEISKTSLAGISTKSTILAALAVVSTTKTPWTHPLPAPTIIESEINLPTSSLSVHGTVELLVYDTADYAPTIPVSVITTPGTAENQPFWS